MPGKVNQSFLNLQCIIPDHRMAAEVICVVMCFLTGFQPPAAMLGCSLNSSSSLTVSIITNYPLIMTATSPMTVTCPPCKRPTVFLAWTIRPSMRQGSASGCDIRPKIPCMRPWASTVPGVAEAEAKGDGPTPLRAARGSSWEESLLLCLLNRGYLPCLLMLSDQLKVMLVCRLPIVEVILILVKVIEGTVSALSKKKVPNLLCLTNQTGCEKMTMTTQHHHDKNDSFPSTTNLYFSKYFSINNKRTVL